MPSKEYTIKTQFYDVDSMGVVWHGNYVKFLETARCEFLDEIKCNYLKMKDNGFALPVIRLDIKYIKYINFNQQIKVKLEILDYDVILRIKYSIYDALSNELLCLATTTQVAVSTEGITLYELPQILKNAIKESLK